MTQINGIALLSFYEVALFFINNLPIMYIVLHSVDKIVWFLYITRRGSFFENFLVLILRILFKNETFMRTL